MTPYPLSLLSTFKYEAYALLALQCLVDLLGDDYLTFKASGSITFTTTQPRLSMT